ncbi:MAG: diguanylate cyclase [Nitrospirota bacterium]
MRILIADDDSLTCRILETALSAWGYQVVVARDGQAAWEILQRAEAPQLAILDWMMPELDGTEVCQRIRQRAAQPYMYLLLLTARSCKTEIIKGLNAGADDYLTKPVDFEELRARLRAGQRILDLQAELIAAREAFQAQATHDPLTGLWNRAAIFETLGQEFARAKREQAAIGVVLADLDSFKQVNDTYGHLAGDRVLCEAARRMSAAVRPYDAIGRYGGEEFLAVLPGCNGPDAVAVAERVREALERASVEVAEGQIVPITASLGVAAGRGDDAGEPDALVKAADAALYRAKESGGNRTELGSVSRIAAGAP